MQKLWQLKVTWNYESLPTELHTSRQVYRHQIASLGELKINRHSKSRQNRNAWLLRCLRKSIRSVRVYKSNKWKLLCSKSRVAPLSTTTIARLEVCRAILLSKLVHKIQSVNFHVDSCSLWTDSSVMLAWTQAPPTAWKQLVSNRVTEIQVLTKTCTWRHVRTSHSPADIISRGLNPPFKS